jgi:RNA polymerase-binding transcription factor DksA
MIAHAQVEDADIIRFKRQLECERDALTEEMNAELARRDKGADHPHVLDGARDRGDEAVADLYSDLALASIQSHVERLRAVESALYRIKKDVYGVCIVCAKSVHKARLAADPAVERCIECQIRTESAPSAKDVTPSL